MPHVNVEIKARRGDPDAVRAALLGMGARMLGPDRQIDTYFRVPNGRLKLREGLIENNLIFYAREDVEGPKRSDVILYGTRPSFLKLLFGYRSLAELRHMFSDCRTRDARATALLGILFPKRESVVWPID